MYDDLLGPRKEKKNIPIKTPYDAGCDQENKPAQPEKFDSHRSTSSDSGQDTDKADPKKDHWADVDSDVVDEDIEDLILEEALEELEELEEEGCEKEEECDDCKDCDDMEEATDPA